MTELDIANKLEALQKEMHRHELESVNRDHKTSERLAVIETQVERNSKVLWSVAAILILKIIGALFELI